MTRDLILALSLFAFVTSITPGPNNLILLMAGLSMGFRKTIPQIFGITIGFSVLVLACGVGLGQLISATPILAITLKVLGSLYILWLTYRILMSGAVDVSKSTYTPLTFWEACLFPWTNPKAWVMGVAAVTTYAPADYTLMDVVTITAVFAAINAPSIAVWSAFGSLIRNIVGNARLLSLLNIVFAALLVMSLIPIIFA